MSGVTLVAHLHVGESRHMCMSEFAVRVRRCVRTVGAANIIRVIRSRSVVLFYDLLPRDHTLMHRAPTPIGNGFLQ